MTARPYAVVAGGGTGGHVGPALAIARALEAHGHPRDSIRFVGSSRGMERRLVPAAGFSITLLPGRGIARRLTVDNVGALAGLAFAAVRAVWLLGRWRPRIVVSVGGYASVAGALATIVWRVPLVVQEQNAVPGMANRVFGHFATASAISFAGTPLPRAVLTGNPVRPEMLAVDRTERGRNSARQALDLPVEGQVVVVSGGSLGARHVNQAVAELATRWAERRGLAIRHVVGERDWDAMVAAAPHPVAGGLVYQQVCFEDRMDLLYAAADVAVQRAGASTVFELAAAGVPAVLVPLPGSPGDHQSFNAGELAGAGAAVVVLDAELTADRLASELDSLLGDPDRLAAMGAAGASVARPDAAGAVALLMEAKARA